MGPKDAGDLTERVRFERRVDVDDGYGNKRGDWRALIATRRVSLRPTRGGEQTIAARLQGTAAFDLWVSFDAETQALTTDDRVVDANDETRTFAIRFRGDMDGRRMWLFMQLELGSAD